MVLLFGYGSLLSPASTALTIKTAKSRRIGILKGYERSFNLVSVSQIKMNPAHLSTMEVGALSVRPGDGHVVGVLFEIDDVEFPAYKRREARYEIVEVPVEEENGSVTMAFTAVESSDPVCFAREFGDDATRQYEEIGQYYSGSLWHNPAVLPSKPYVHVCINGALTMGADVFLNLLSARLANGVTTLEQHLLREPMRRIERTLKGDPLPASSPIIGPAIESLARPLVVIIAPADSRSRAEATWKAWRRRKRSPHDVGMLFVNWCPHWQRYRLQAVLDFVLTCPVVVGAAVISASLQAAVFEAACSRFDSVSCAVTCVDGVCECPPNCCQRPSFAATNCVAEKGCAGPTCCVPCPVSDDLSCCKLVLSPTCSGLVASIVKHASGFQVACAPSTMTESVSGDDDDPVLLWSLNRITFTRDDEVGDNDASAPCCAGSSSLWCEYDDAELTPGAIDGVGCTGVPSTARYRCCE